MIKKIPGWANFFILWAIYAIGSFGVYYLMNWMLDGEITTTAFIIVITAIYAGAYLAKWRFSDGNYRYW